MDLIKRVWATVDLNAVLHNFEVIRSRVDSRAKIMGIVKADGYGHGAVQIARTLLSKGCDYLGVSNLEEALQLRSAGIGAPILILGYTPESCAKTLFENRITQAVFSREYGLRLAQRAKADGVQVHIHIKIDTGMSRIGFFYHDPQQDTQTVEDIAGLCALSGIFAEGIFTHFAQSDTGNADEAFTKQQFSLFTDLIAKLKARGITFALRHCANSGAIISYPQMHLDMVRAGIILYGLEPSDELAGALALRPALALHAVVSMVKDLPAGETVSYGRTYTADSPRRVATVPIGYADGYPRLLSSNAAMLVNGKRAPVIGRVCMDQLMLDVTGIDGVCEGTAVTVYGSDGSEQITLEEVAKRCGTINYEIACMLSKRVPRIYLHDGAVVETVNHILP
jgi:alanine racemase